MPHGWLLFIVLLYLKSTGQYNQEINSAHPLPECKSVSILVMKMNDIPAIEKEWHGTLI